MEESLKDGEDAVVADLDAAEVLQPGVGAFDFPALAVAAELSLIFKSAMAVVAAVRSDRFCAAPFQSRAQRVGVVAAIGDHEPRRERGRPRPLRGTFTCSSVLSASRCSEICADASCAPTGTPRPSTTTMHFVPFPRRVLPTPRPLFLR